MISINNCSYGDLKTIVFFKKESFGFYKKNAHKIQTSLKCSINFKDWISFKETQLIDRV